LCGLEDIRSGNAVLLSSSSSSSCGSISKKNTLRSVSPHSPCAPDVPGAYNVNSCSGSVRPGSFCPEVKGPRPMRPDAQVSIRTHWTRKSASGRIGRGPFCVLTHLTPPGAATPLILYPQRPASSYLRSQCTLSHAAFLRTSSGRDISPPGLPSFYPRPPAFFP